MSAFPSDVPSYTVRPMRLEDLPAVREIDRDAFEMARRQAGASGRALRLRTLENMRAAVQRPHAGVVIEWPPGRVAGYCFTHVWGSVGWLGTLGVTPRKQGMGLGRAVTAAGLDLLHTAGCQVLALETMPESGKNIALYTRLGLHPGYMTLLCQGSPPPSQETHFETWCGDDALRRVASQIVPGLDPTPAAVWLDEEGAGETLVWREDGAPAAFAILRSTPRRLEGAQAYLTVEAAACLPQAAIHWPRYLRETQTYAERQAKLGIVLPINAAQIDLLRDALDAGMRVVHTRVRMATSAALERPDAILLLTLAM